MISNLLVTLAILLTIGLLVVVAWTLRRWQQSSTRQLNNLINEISTDKLANIVLPNGTDGEIHIDRLLLTPYGFIALEIKDVAGMVFAGERMQQWSATLNGARVAFDNPIPRLQECAAAVQTLTPGVPVEARAIFIEPVTFPKGHPPQATTLTALRDEYLTSTADQTPQTFASEWEVIRSEIRYQA